jgi:hypothetical protein
VPNRRNGALFDDLPNGGNGAVALRGEGDHANPTPSSIEQLLDLGGIGVTELRDWMGTAAPFRQPWPFKMDAVDLAGVGERGQRCDVGP